MTGLSCPLRRWLRLLLLCSMLAVASTPTWPVFARDTIAISLGTATSTASNSASKRAAAFAEHTAPQVHEAFELAARLTPELAASAQEVDQRYLYLELMTLLS